MTPSNSPSWRCSRSSLGEREAVGGSCQGVKSGLDRGLLVVSGIVVICRIALADENAVRLRLAAADAATQLMQLGQAETIRVENHHHRRLGHVHAHLQNRRSDHDGHLAGAEAVHSLIALAGLHLAVNDLDRWQRDVLARHLRRFRPAVTDEPGAVLDGSRA